MPEVGVAPGQTGLLWCAAARFSLAGLQHSLVVFVGRLVSELAEKSSERMLDFGSRDTRSALGSCGRALHRGLSGAVEPSASVTLLKNQRV